VTKILRDNTLGTYDFVDHFTDEIYLHYVVPLLSDLRFVMSDSSIPFENPLCERQCRSDLEYLEEMQRMDTEIKRNLREEKQKYANFTLTHVVPVAGLIMARITITECELRTAVEIWGKKSKPLEEKKRKRGISDLLFRPSNLLNS
jgi:hypothetical protein